MNNENKEKRKFKLIEKFKNLDFSDRNQVKVLALVIMVVCVIMVGTSYAWLVVTTTSSKDVGLTAGTLDLAFDDSTSSVITLTDTVPISDSDGVKSTGYTFSIKNTGNITSDYAIYLDDVNLSSGEARLDDKYVKYNLVKNSSSIGTNLISNLSDKKLVSATVKSGSTDTYTLRVWLDEDAFNSDATSKVFKKTLRIEGSQAAPVKVCKRATTLHTATCTQTSTSYYCSGAGYTATGSKGTTTITYGNLGTKGTLISGDAFDCDVNGDGTYDSNTERFYYVTDMNSDTAVMIYYNNTASGVANNSIAFAYDVGGDAYTNGPVTALAQLPTTTQWSNVSLTNITRDLVDYKDVVMKTGFSYTGHAARLLTIQELETACGITESSHDWIAGELDSCTYLLENTNYQSINLLWGYWLENPGFSTDFAWAIFGYARSVSIENSDDGRVNNGYNFSVRPAIEILKSDISY